MMNFAGAQFVCSVLSMRKTILFFCLLLPFFTFAQPASYPQNYFRNPLDLPMLLAGNFGECRPNHFHSGIDLKTKGKENFPVFAAAEGYISRIKMEKGGFGHALYITHPNGFTTLYAHLNNFMPAVQRFTKKMQYEKQSWAQDIGLGPDQFPVKKGQQIAWSGNTGGSTAPHLHFEIRDSKTEHPLNPMLFGFPIADSRASVPLQLAFYDRNQSIYEQKARIVALQKKADYYTVSGDTITVNSDKIGLGISVNDFMNGSDNTLNFLTAVWYLDEEMQGSIRLDDIGYDVTRYLHAYVDYKERKLSSRWFQLLFQLPGNALTHLYTSLNQRRGVIALEDGNPHQVRIFLKDAAGNETRIAFMIKAGATSPLPQCTNVFEANRPNNFEHPNVRFALNEADLYERICFQFSAKPDEKSLSDRYKIHVPYVPVHGYFDLNIKPNKPISFDLRDKVVLMYDEGKSVSGKAASFENGWYTAAVRNFGTYWLDTDTTPPVITPLQKQSANLSAARQIRFRVKEATTSVRKFRAELDGKWICFEPAGDVFFYTFDEHCAKGKHKLTITASDENGNSATLVYNFTR